MVDQNYTHLSLIVDRSGSMITIKDDMQGAIAALLEEQAKVPGKILVDITTFDHQIEAPYDDAELSEIKTSNLITPRGSTALIDAIGVSVVSLGEKLADLDEADRPGKVLVVIVTDGQENSSHEYTQEQVKGLIQKQTDEFNWDFIFLGANIDSAAVGGGFGILRGNTMNYQATAAGVADLGVEMSGYVTKTRSGIKPTLNNTTR